MGLRREVDDRVDVVLVQHLSHERAVADVAMHEAVATRGPRTRQVLEIAGVRQLVEVHDEAVRVLRQHHPDEVAPDETRAACDQDSPHTFPVRKNPCEV